MKYFLQNLKIILFDQEPMPLYGVKLLNILTIRDISFVSALKNLKYLNIIMDFFNVNNPKLSVVTLKLISRIVECKDITLEDLSSFNFFANVSIIFILFSIILIDDFHNEKLLQHESRVEL